MANQKLQVQRAVSVVPSDTIAIPDVAKKTLSSAATATTADKLVDSAGLFTTTNLVTVGNIVQNTTDGTIATVTAVDSATQLSLSADIMASGENYTLYRASTEDCVLYVGVSGDLNVLTAGGDLVTYVGVPVGFFPVHIKKVLATSTTATNIIANW